MPWKEFPDFTIICQNIRSGDLARGVASREPTEIEESAWSN